MQNNPGLACTSVRLMVNQVSWEGGFTVVNSITQFSTPVNQQTTLINQQSTNEYYCALHCVQLQQKVAPLLKGSPFGREV